MGVTLSSSRAESLLMDTKEKEDLKRRQNLSHEAGTFLDLPFLKYPTPTFTQNHSLAKATVTPRPLASLLCTRYCCRVLLCTTTPPLSSFYTQGHHSFGGSDSQDQDLTGHGARTQLAKLQSRVGSAPSLHYTRGPSPGNSPDVSPNRQTSHMPVCRRPARRR